MPNPTSSSCVQAPTTVGQDVRPAAGRSARMSVTRTVPDRTLSEKLRFAASKLQKSPRLAALAGKKAHFC